MTMLATYSLMSTDGDIFNCHFIWSTLHECINLGRLLVVAYHYMSVNVTEEERYLLRKGGVFDIFKRSEFAVLKKGFEWVVGSETWRSNDTVRRRCGILVSLGTRHGQDIKQ